MRLTIVGFILSAVGLVLQSWLAFFLLRKKIHERFPSFVTYTLYAAMVIFARLVLSNHYSIYFYAYWTTEVGFAILAILALHEAYRWIFALLYQALWFRLIFWTVLAVIAAASVRNAVLHPPIEAPAAIRIIFSLEIGVHYIQAGVFALIFLLVIFFRLRWRVRAYGIVMGFAASALGSLASFWIRSEFGTNFDKVAQYGPPVAYLLAVVIWLDAFLGPQEPDAEDKWAEAIDPRNVLPQIREGVATFQKFWRRRNGR